MSEDAKPQVTKEPDVNEHGVTVGVDLNFADVLKMQRAIWAAGQPAASEEDESATAKKPAKAKK